MDSASLRERQALAIERMLKLNTSGRSEDIIDDIAAVDEETLWKVLVLDSHSTGIISSILRVNDLLRTGVTVHALIGGQRATLPEVPAVYFVEPTIKNIEAIAADVAADQYAAYYINFTTVLPRELLERLAELVALTGRADRVKQVYDQYLDFVVTESELFSLEIPRTFAELNNPRTTEDRINQLCGSVANGIFNVIMTLENIPVIRAPRGGPAEIVANKLSELLRDHMVNTRKTGAQTNTSETTIERSVLIILDRNIDFASMFAHSWIYQCMVFDIFKLAKNTITITTEKQTDSLAPEANNSKTVTTKQFDLDPRDFFWAANSHLPFPEAAENIETTLNAYKEEAAEITKKTGVSSLDDLDPNNNSMTGGLQVQDIVKKLSDLTFRKSIIDTHMNIFASLLSQLENKGLDSFFEVEQEPDSSKTRTRFLDSILHDGKTNNMKDKLRSFIVLYLTSPNGLPKEFIDQVENYFKDFEEWSYVLKYIYRLRDFMQLSSKQLQNKSLEDGKSKQSTGGNLSLSGLYGLTEGTLQGGMVSLLTGIKKLLPEKKTIPITNVVDAIMDPLNSSQKNLETTDDYLYFDPKNIRGPHTKKPKRQTYNTAVVFVVGGGNYLEYQNLQEWSHAQIHNVKRVMYGSTTIETPNEFLSEVAELGKSS